MNEIFHMVLALVGGMILGIFFFGGLWYTVKKAVTSKKPVLLFLGSFFLRITITLVGFYYIANGDFKAMLVCVSGFMIARFIVTKTTKPKGVQQTEKEVGHEA